MAKLIYADSLSTFKQLYANYAQNTDAIYRSVVFCHDGYIVTHGTVLSTGVGEKTQNPYGLALGIGASGEHLGQLQVSLGKNNDAWSEYLDLTTAIGAGNYLKWLKDGANSIPRLHHLTAVQYANEISEKGTPEIIISASDYNALSSEDKAKYIEITEGPNNGMWRKPAENYQEATGTLTASNNTITDESNQDTATVVIPSFKYDIYGHIHEVAATKYSVNRVLLEVSETNSEYYLLASSVTADKDGDTPWKNGELNVSKTASTIVGRNITINPNTGTISAKLVKINGVTVADMISLSYKTNQAMVYKGIVNSADDIPNKREIVVNQETKVTSEGHTYKVGTSFTYNGHILEIGDTLICEGFTGGDEDPNAVPVWNILQTNIDGALISTDNLNGVLFSSGSRTVESTSGSNNQYLKWSDAKEAEYYTTADLLGLDENTLQYDATVGKYIKTPALPAKPEWVNMQTLNIKATATDAQSSAKELLYTPTSIKTLLFNNGLFSIECGTETIKIGHKVITRKLNAQGDPKGTPNFFKITVDDYGHVTADDPIGTYSIGAYNKSIVNEEAVYTQSGTALSTYFGDDSKLGFINSDDGDIKFTMEEVSSGTYAGKYIKPSINHRYKKVGFLNTSDVTVTETLEEGLEKTYTYTYSNPHYVEGEDARNAPTLTFLAANANTIFSWTSDGKLQLETKNTWRPVYGYKLSSETLSGVEHLNDTSVLTNTNTQSLVFGNEFMFSESDSSLVGEELHLVWEELSLNANSEVVKSFHV